MTEKVFEPSLLLDRAVKCGDWMVRNQITDRMDANKGRSIRSYDADTKELRLTGNWMCGTMAASLCALWKRTGDRKYLDGAVAAARYIMSLQVMDRDDPYFGAIREITPQSIEFAPRDATGAAWGLVWVAEATGESLYLDRARLFADWLVEKGMYRGWPLYAIYMDPNLDNFYSRGSFQSGTGLFLYDLFRLTGDPKYIERGLLPIATIYRDEFIKDDGTLILERDPFTGKVTHAADEDLENLPQHALNDDFGAAMMIQASRFFNDPSYVWRAAMFVRWVASVQEEDGGFAGGRIPSAVPVAEMYMRDIGEELNDRSLVEAADRALAKLITMQWLDTGDPRLDGGFQGVYEGVEPNKWGRRCVNMRTTSYALIALIKAESDLADIWLGTHNKPFQDHRWIGLHDLVF